MGLFWTATVIPPGHNWGVTCTAANTITAEALALIEAGLDLLDEATLKPRDEVDAVVCIKAVEQVRRRVDSAGLLLMTQIERFDLHRDDGYGSVKAMFRHHGGLSNAEANARSRSAKMCVELPDVDAACRSGELPVDNVRQLGRAFANPRVADVMVEQESWLLGKALELGPIDFAAKLKIWEDLNDQDGPEPEAERHHRNRRYRFVKGFDKAWGGEHHHGSLQGAGMHDIFQHYLEAETLADWDKARAEHGDDAAGCHLERTVAQRSADALYRIYEDAAANADSPVPVGFVHNLVWNQETFEYFLARYFGADPEPMHPDDYLCQTIDGIPVNPIEAITSALVSKIRRAVVGANGTVIDLGEARQFTGSARAAVKLAATECVWPSCRVPTSRCETDHMVEHSKQGRTDPGNGAPLCGKHNRWKQKGFTVHRDPQGNWHTRRPNGTEIDP